MAGEITVARERNVESLKNVVSERTMRFANPSKKLSGERKTRDAILNRAYSLVYRAREKGEFEKEARIWNASENMLEKTQSVSGRYRRRRSTYSPKAEKWKWGD